MWCNFIEPESLGILRHPLAIDNAYLSPSRILASRRALAFAPTSWRLSVRGLSSARTGEGRGMNALGGVSILGGAAWAGRGTGTGTVGTSGT